jgi:hypothetical protein
MAGLPTVPKLDTSIAGKIGKKFDDFLQDTFSPLQDKTVGDKAFQGNDDPFYQNVLAPSPYAINNKSLSLYTTTPYGFRYKVEGVALEFWLPINPSNLNITTNFANNVTATLFGSVEQRSIIKIYNISISGNTGIAPRNVRPTREGKGTAENSALIEKNKGTGAQRYIKDKTAPTLLPGRSGPQIGALTKIGTTVANLDPTGFVSGFIKKQLNPVLDAVNQTADSIFGTSAPSGFLNPNSGYAAFHNFYRFLWGYQQLVGEKGRGAERPSDIKLYFMNYKDNYKMHVSPQRFQMTRSTENPLLYNYAIELVGMSIGTVDEDLSESAQAMYDRQLAELGLDGVRSTTMKGMVNNVGGAVKNLKAAGGKVGIGL